jgi:adenylate cyclase
MALTRSYFAAQVERSLATYRQILNRSAGAASGRLIPETNDLAIHDGRRIEATVMFLDICKFSQRPAETAEEQNLLMQIVALFFTEMIRIIEDYGGVVEKNTGDGLMAYFASQAGDADTIQRRALSAALTMFAAADQILNPLLRQSYVAPLDFRICMDHGFVTIAKVGAARRFNGLVAVGTTANIASKMLAVAKENTILLGERMLPGLPADWLVRTIFETSDTGFNYRATGEAYRFWRYIGRWVIPA